MNRTGIEKALRNAVNCAPGLSFDKLAAMPYIKAVEQDYITKQRLNIKVIRTRQFPLAAACCLVLIVLLSGWYIRNRVPDSVITLDVNPSIEIRTNLKNEILSVRAINEDAKEVINNNDYKGEKLEAVVPLLMNSLVERKYINMDQNAILLTVTNRSEHKADSVIKKIDTEIRESLSALNITPTILSQKLAKEAERAKLAGQYGLSEGKLNLVLDIIASNSSYTLEDLAGRSIMQLFEIAKANSVDLRKYFTQGENSDSGNNPGNNTNENAGEIKDTDGDTDQEDSHLEEDNTKADTGESKDNEGLNNEENNDGGQNNEENNDDSLNNENQDNRGQDIGENDTEDKQEDVRTATTGQGDEGDNQDSQISDDTKEEGNNKEDALPVDNKDEYDYSYDQKNSDDQENSDGNSYINNNWNSDSDSEDSNNENDNSDTSSGDEDNQGDGNED